MKHDKADNPVGRDLEIEAPMTVEGFAVLHQMFRIDRAKLRALGKSGREKIASEAAARLDAMSHREDGESALFSGIGHKADLIIVHFRRSFDELNQAENEIAALGIGDFLEQTTSYLSTIEIGLYEATVALHARLAEQSIR